MAESFNELDVQHEWEEITHTHTRVQRVHVSTQNSTSRSTKE